MSTASSDESEDSPPHKESGRVDGPVDERIPAIEWEYPPEKLDEEFIGYTKVKNLLPEDPEARKRGQWFQVPRSSHDNVKSRKTYASFGENGTTVSVNSRGRIMQISRFLGYGRSGFFCADHWDLSEPYLVQRRMNELMNRSEDDVNGLWLHLDHLVDIKDVHPSLEFTFDRWPRFVFQPRDTAEPQVASQEKQTKAPQQASASTSRDNTSGNTLSSPELSIQYFCHKGTVFQRYLFQINTGTHSSQALDKLMIDTDVCIRNLDFERGDSQFNENDQGLDYRAGPHDCSLIILHRITLKMAKQMGIDEYEYQKVSGPKAAALIITPFVNGIAQKVVKWEEEWYIDLKDVSTALMTSGGIDITLGYRLQLLEEQQKWKHSLVPAAHLEHMAQRFCSTETFQRIRFSQHDQFDFLIRRNLEHILSVCCIPIPESPTLGSPDTENSATDETNNYTLLHPIAITCGDISSHFIGQRTTLSIFQFLCSLLRFLEPIEDCSQRHPANPEHLERGNSTAASVDCEICKKLYKRIGATLAGHVKWICSRAQVLKNGAFSPHYWPTGECITQWDSLPLPSLIDTPLQLLKILWLYYLDLERDGEVEDQGAETEEETMRKQLTDISSCIPAEHIGRLHGKIVCWLFGLDNTNFRSNYAFWQQFEDNWIKDHLAPEPPDEVIPKFRLTDHIMICLAMKCVERLETIHKGIHARVDIMCKEYSYQKTRSKALKRFTVDGPLSKQPMLATCRTPGENRFLFHSKDTFLFHAMEIRFFDNGDGGSARSGTKKKRAWTYTDTRWKNTVDAQAYHDEYQYLEWENPLWYALAFILGCQRKQINKFSTEEILRATAHVLLNAPLPSGLFPGRLGPYQESLPFNNEVNRDSYWNATFETLHMLWANGKEYFDREGSREKTRTNAKDVSFDASHLAEILARNTSTTRDAARIGQLLTKKVPFDNTSSLIDQRNLVQIQDDWLRDWPRPPDFVFEPIINTQLPGAPINGREQPVSTVDTAAIDKASTRQTDVPQAKAAVIDVPKKVICQAKLENYTSLDSLDNPRTMRFAKKRIIWLAEADEKAKRLCCNASPTVEKEDLSHFFDNHASHDQHLLDRATLALNKWETELHLSFFRLNEPEEKENTQFLERLRERIQNVSFVKIEASEKDLRKETVFLSQETISFRFVGDFFDRFWTCHFLDNYGEEPRRRSAARLKGFPEVTPVANTPSTDTSMTNNPVTFNERLTRSTEADGNQLGDHWKQRKVLELALFGMMLEEIYVSTEDILEWVKERVLKRPGPNFKNSPSRACEDVVRLSPSQPAVDGSLPLNSIAEAVLGVQLLRRANSDNYSAISDNWRLFEQILQAIEDDLSGNIEIITQWTRREDERGSEKPRWTLGDEKRYRATIARMTVSNQRKIRRIERLKARIKAFRESLPGRLESVRDDISFRGSENINLFTYVTVVFLPLGFATGIFSMSEAPSRVTLVSMVELAFIALAITVFALANAKTTGKVPVRLVIWAFRCINNLLLLLMVWIWNQAIFLYWFYSRIPSSNINQADDKSLSEEASHTKRISKAVASVLRSDLSSSLESALEENPREKAKKSLDGKRKLGNSKNEADGAGTDVKHADSTGWCLSWLRKLYSGRTPEDEENARRTEPEIVH